MAWWALPFIYQSSNSKQPIRALFIGFHKPSKFGAPARPDITLVREPSIIESFPFSGRDLPRISAGIAVCSSDLKILSNATQLANMASVRPNTYREWNTHSMEITDAVILAGEYGEKWEAPVDTKSSHIRLLKGAYSYDLRKGHGVSVRVLIAVGKDIRKNVPVLLLKKSWRNFTDIVWLWENGNRILGGFFFLVMYPPVGSKISFLSDHELDMGVKRWMRTLEEEEFVPYNSGMSISDLVEALKLE